MINPSEVSPLSLPFVGLSEKRKLPHRSGIYFVIEGETIIYIGKAISILLRWQGHNKLGSFKSRQSQIRIAWLDCSDASLLTEIERLLVAFFDPELNLPQPVGPRKRNVSSTPRGRIVCKLQHFLDAEGLTQSDLAEETGLAVSTIGGYCRNQINRIDVVTAEVLCERFKTDMCGLFPTEDRR